MPLRVSIFKRNRLRTRYQVLNKKYENIEIIRFITRFLTVCGDRLSYFVLSSLTYFVETIIITYCTRT